MRRFGQQCGECKNEKGEYYSGTCSETQVWFAIESLLYNIVKRYYENAVDEDAQYYVIAVSDVPPRGHVHSRAAVHRKELCEACHNHRCQEYMTISLKEKDRT